MQDSVVVGDGIITAGGVHAVVLEDDGDELRVEIAPDVVVTLDRRAVAAVAREIEVEVEPEDDPKGGSDAPREPS
jgi:preprotein translocase subunit YajC